MFLEDAKATGLSRYELDAEVARNLRVPILPPLWKRALQRVQEVFPEAILAGGCLRDLVLGRTAKDLDIVIPLPETEAETAGLYARMESIEGAASLFHFSSPGEYAMSIAGVHSVTELRLLVVDDEDLALLMPERENLELGYCLPIPTIQLIVIDPKTSTVVRGEVEAQKHRDFFSLVAHRADFGICRIAHDGRSWLITDEFFLDAMHRAFTLFSCTSANEHVRRFIRLQQKYPGWQPVDNASGGGDLGFLALLDSYTRIQMLAASRQDLVKQGRRVPPSEKNTHTPYSPSQPIFTAIESSEEGQL